MFETVQPMNATSRRALIAAVAGGMLSTVFSSVGAQEASTPEILAEGDPDAIAILKKAVSRLAYLETFSFSLETIEGKSTIFAGMELVSISGVVRRPFDFHATIKARVSVMLLVIEVISLDRKLYIQDPTAGGTWTEIGTAPEIINMINPDWLLQMAMNFVQDAHITDTANNETLIEGSVDLARVIQQPGDNADDDGDAGGLQILADDPFDVAFWINGEDYLVRTEIYGPIFAAESADVQKRIELSAFNEPVVIEAPSI